MSTERHSTVTLVGWTSAWQTRTHVPDTGKATTTPLLTVTWMHHRAYGMIGVYWTETIPGTMLDVGKQRPWVVITGQVAPCAVVARGDDPRAGTNRMHAPLLVAVTGIRKATPADRGASVCLPHPAWITVSTCRRVHGGSLGVSPQADLAYWQSGHLTPGRYPWHTVYGVVGTIRQERYLRYVVSAGKGGVDERFCAGDSGRQSAAGRTDAYRPGGWYGVRHQRALCGADQD